MRNEELELEIANLTADFEYEQGELEAKIKTLKERNKTLGLENSRLTSEIITLESNVDLLCTF